MKRRIHFAVDALAGAIAGLLVISPYAGGIRKGEKWGVEDIYYIVGCSGIAIVLGVARDFIEMRRQRLPPPQRNSDDITN